MEIRGFGHKALKRLYKEDNPRGLPLEAIDKLRKILAFLQDMQDPGELRAFPLWKAHQLTGDRKGSLKRSLLKLNKTPTNHYKQPYLGIEDYELRERIASRISRRCKRSAGLSWAIHWQLLPVFCRWPTPHANSRPFQNLLSHVDYHISSGKLFQHRFPFPFFKLYVGGLHDEI